MFKIILGFTCIIHLIFLQEIDLQEARDIYLREAANKCPSDVAIRKMQGVKNLKPAFLAYYGVLQAMQAECTGNPAKKLEYFNQGKANIEKAFKLNEQSFDVRFARFTLQDNIPNFLGYDNMETDGRFLINHFHQINHSTGIDPFYSQVAEILVGSGYFNKKEESFLRTFY